MNRITLDDLQELEQIKQQAPSKTTSPEEGGGASRLDKQGRAYSTGKRKNAIARVWLKPGRGQIIINKKPLDQYFARPVLRMLINQPFAISRTEKQYDVVSTVKGGGLSGQAGAVRHGISLALLKATPDSRVQLKKTGLLTRDRREVERKKYGRHKARRGCQFSKR